MVMTETQPQGVSALPGQEYSLPTAAGSVEIKFQSVNPTADQAPCRIIIVQPGAASDRSTEFTGASSGFGFTGDEEPTWEDAAWQ